MATLKAVVDHRKADGTYCVKIRLTHNRKSLYIPTALYVTDRQLTKSNKIKDHNIIMASNRIIDEMRAVILDIPGLEYMDCERLRRVITARMAEGKEFRMDFYQYAAEKMATMGECTRSIYASALIILKELTGAKLDINDVTYNLMIKYRDMMIDKGFKINSIVMYMGKVKHLINLAKDEYNDDDTIRIRVNPFRKGVVPDTEATRHRILTAEQIRRIATIKGDRCENFAIDMFLLSFYLIGINLVDLYHLTPDNVQDDVLTYSRSKTAGKRKDKAVISVRIEPEARVLLEKYSDMTGKRLLNLYLRYRKHINMTLCLNTYLKRLCNYDDTLPNDLTYYYARHTWATIAYNDCGLDMQTIHEALNHASSSEMKITDVYVKKDFSRIWEANRKVMDYVFGEKNNPQHVGVGKSII